MANRVSLKKIAAALVLAGMAAGTAQAASTTGHASATVIAPLSIAETTPMNFAIVAGDVASATTVVLTPGGVASSPSTPPAYVAGIPAAALFTVTGDPNRAYTLDLTNGGAPILLTGPGAPMTLTSLTDNSTLAIGAGGTATFNVGGTLNINPNQLAGSYAGTYTVVVNY